MGWQFPGLLHSWQQQERQALANPGWRSMLRVAVPLLPVLVGLVGLVGARRLQERAQNLEEKQQEAIDLLYWLAGEQRRTAEILKIPQARALCGAVWMVWRASAAAAGLTT